MWRKHFKNFKEILIQFTLSKPVFRVFGDYLKWFKCFNIFLLHVYASTLIPVTSMWLWIETSPSGPHLLSRCLLFPRNMCTIFNYFTSLLYLGCYSNLLVNAFFLSVLRSAGGCVTFQGMKIAAPSCEAIVPTNYSLIVKDFLKLFTHVVINP